MGIVSRSPSAAIREVRGTWRAWRWFAAVATVASIIVIGIGARLVPEAHAATRVPRLASPQGLFNLFGPARRDRLAETQGQLDLANAQIERLTAVIGYSSQYRIAADLAASVYDVALAERIEPELAFRLVKVESDFNERATSPAGAVGLMQIMPSTARFFVPGVTATQLYDRDTNLRVGLRYLHTLVRENRGDLKRALLIYNRGEIAVGQSLQQGIDPSNGYDRVVVRGYKGNGIID
jgi:soluble lytic murein transglycosylase-like protein